MSVTSDLDIYRSAKLLIDQHGEDAAIFAVMQADKRAEAEPLIERSLATRENALGSQHPDVAESLENYAALLRDTGRGTEAGNMEARAKAIRAKHAR